MRIRRKRQERTAAGRMPPANTPTVREAALAARVAELEAELRARNDFLAIAAHELRNPMTPISARLELLLAKARQTTEGAPAGLVQSLETLERLVNAYLRRATTLLDVARISGKLKLQTAEVDLSALVRQATANILPLAEGAGCQVRTAIDDGITGRCDAMAVEQILETLLSNAIRYAPGQPIEVAFASNGEAARLSVRDHGVGISDCEQALIFERFRHPRPPRPNGGFGVGLWITRQLVHAMRGEISVSSTPGAGSIFSVKWPLFLPCGPQDAD
jgi:two-component system, OmpR family, sensor kinase